MQFESLGKNCELGIVQRCAGIEPLGLFRFAFTPLAPLLRCVAESFAGLAREDNVRLETAADGEYMVRLSDYGFVYHTARKTGEIDPEQLREDEVRRLGFMIRKLRAELQSPAKIFVRYGEGPEDFDAIKTLQAELRRFGPVKLLWVTEATPAQRPGTVTMLEPDLMHGAIDKFAHSDDAQSTSFTCWADLCRNALALTQLQAGPGTALSAPWRGNAAANLLAGRLTAAGQSDITEITVSGLAPNRMYTASLWIKAGPIPPDTARLIADGLNSRRTRRANPPFMGAMAAPGSQLPYAC